MKSRPNLRFLLGAAVLAGSVFFTSCVTDDQVKQIVTDSNLAAMSAQLDLGAVNPDGSAAGGNWQEASKKIEAVIAANPEQKALNAALRVRQAVMLLQNRQYNLAQAAFDEAASGDLHTSRDRALKSLQAELIWWYRTAGDTESVDFTKAKSAQAKIDEVRGGLKAKEDEGIRDLLAAMRAFIGVKMAKDVYDTNGAENRRKYLEDAIDTFAAGLPAGESAAWASPPEWPPSGMSLQWAVSGPNRRHFTAESLITAAKAAQRANAITGVEVSDPYFRRRLAE